MAASKAPEAFRTIGELSDELGVAQHILRYWETKFPLRPLQRAGNRRYYRPADVELARRINRLLNQEGYTIRGVQKLLRDGKVDVTEEPDPIPPGHGGSSVSTSDLRRIRNRLRSALDD
jgi:DNA-binding transcriptional MerR regulator